MAHDNDGWGVPYDDQTYVSAYDELEMALLAPLDRQLPEANPDEFRPKFKNQKDPKSMKLKKKKRNGDDEWRDVLYNLGSSSDLSDWDHEGRKTYFQPPLQVQRNSFVKKVLQRFRNSTTDIRRLAIMGCGEMSLERALCEHFGPLGTINVLSVDLDEPSLSVGQQLLQKHLTSQSDIIASEVGLPVLMRSFVGDILQPDHRFANVDAIVSLEVVEHIPLEDAKKFVDNVLGVLMPRIFIFSTPNHEYNTVFGMKPGEFRHDDHKFEMSRQEFSAWIDELRLRHPHYRFADPHYIGMTRGFEQLRGASQAAVCELYDNLCSPLEQNVLPYEMVGQIPCRLGTRFVAYNLVRQAFLEWLDKTEFHDAELKESSFAQYWLFDVAHVLHHIHAPVSFAMTIDPKVAIKYIQGMTSHKVAQDLSDNFNGFVVMKHFPKRLIIDTINQNAKNT